jgi:hypothetical protein
VRLDLHCHSTCSDGSESPEHVGRLAAGFGVRLFCLTDHDTMAGYERARGELPGCAVLRGLELSCRWKGRTVHVLVYGVGEGEAADRLQARLDAIQVSRRLRLSAIAARLADLGAPIDEAALVAATAGRTPGRPHVAQALVRAGHVSSLREAFDRFLRDGGPADVPVERLALAEGLALGRATGARMSLAHPHTLGDPLAVRALFQDHRDAGLEGIEAVYGPYARAEREPWLRLAQELGLVVTAGSDFHGEVVRAVARPGIELEGPLVRRLVRWLGVDAAA